ncbi:MAG: fibronectin-binding domain-containing protein, partial [Candidatus Helarchaeota archaeon]|nr:fibronectin-binding domain-containing protein [Candidatus Helarchaeota archaeon]
MKYSMSNFDILAIVSEIKPKIIEGRIQKIYQIESIFILKFKTKTGTINLLVETPNRIHITEYERGKPKIPPNFCVKLRKSTKNLRVLDFYQHNFDRVIVLELGYIQSEKENDSLKSIITCKIIFEFFDKGNVILTDENNILISALRYKTMRDRRIIPNRIFLLPTTSGQNIMNITLEDFQNTLQNSKKRIIPTLVSNLNIGPNYAQEICIRANVDPQAPSNSILEKSEEIFKEIKNLLRPFKEKQFNPQIIYKNSEFYAISPIDLQIFQDLKKKQFRTINEAVDEFYSLQEETIEKKQILEQISESKAKITRLERILNDQKKQLQALIRKGEKFKEYGDLIYQNLGLIQQLVDFVNSSRKNNISWNEIISKLEKDKKEEDSYAKIMTKIIPKKALVELKFGDTQFQIDFTDSPTKIANNFYQKSKKMLKKKVGAEKAIQNTLKKLETAKLEDSIEKPIIDKPRKKRAPKWFEKFRWLKSSDGFLILGGKDVKTNEIIVKKYMNDNDIFIHASFAGAPAVIIQTEGKDLPEQSILEGAQLAISYSGAWKAGYSQADVFWVQGSQVTFTPPSGEYRKKGSFIIKGKKNILKSIPATIRIGFKIEDEYTYPVISPDIEQKDILFPVEICPGDLKSSILAKEIMSYWLSNVKDSKLRNKIKQINIDEIQRLIPTGKGKI